MNGLGLAREVKRIRPDLPILLLTGHAADLPPSVLQEAGIAGVLNKPVTMEELASGVLAALPPALPGGLVPRVDPGRGDPAGG
jgi:CheY-like chemotaxis protein